MPSNVKQFSHGSEASTAVVAISSGTTTAVVAAAAGQTISILFIYLWVASGAQAITLSDGATAFTGVMTVGLASGLPQLVKIDLHDNPKVLTTGNAFNIVTTTSVGVNGYVEYVQTPVNG